MSDDPLIKRLRLGPSMLAQEEAADLLDECERIITRYRSETPLGNQPHMIADKADRLLAKLRANDS